MHCLNSACWADIDCCRDLSDFTYASDDTFAYPISQGRLTCLHCEAAIAFDRKV